MNRKIEMMKTADLIPYERNARTHSPEQVERIAKSLQEFGFVNPVLIDKENGIIAGHGRVAAAKTIGMDEVPCLRVEHLTEEQKRAYILADNRLAEDAGWDDEILRLELQELMQMDFDITVTGFELSDIEIDFTEDNEDVEEDDYQEDEEEVEPTAKMGEVYQLGAHRLMCGDSTNRDDVAKLTAGNEMDLLETDPPYNVDYQGGTGLKIANDNMSDNAFYAFLHDAFRNASEWLKAGGAFYVWHASATAYEFEAALIANDMKQKQQIIWVKNALVLGRQDYQWQHEPCFYGWKEGAAHYFIDDRKKTTVVEDRRPNPNKMSKEEMVALIKEIYSDKTSTTVMHEDKPIASREHPTMKPIKLIARQIANSTKPGEKVLDLFGGSGTTLMACEQLGRACYMMEFDPHYVDVIINRWETYTGQKAVKIEV